MLDRVHLCLVGTSNPENLGGIARLCENFAVERLTLVDPRVSRDDHRALVVGRAALGRLAAIETCAGLDLALGDCVCAVGLSARRGASRPMVGLRELGPLLAERAPSGRVALVFGPEDSGLRRDDLDRCDLVATIALPGPLAALNLTQAVALVLWELSRPLVPLASSGPEPVAADDASRGGATRDELEGLLDHSFVLLEKIGHFRRQDPARARVHLRRLLAAASLRRDAVRGLRGLCAEVLRALGHPSAG